MKLAILLLFFTLLIPGQNASCQYYDTGQDPASVKWMQIKTDRFTVIYPEKYGDGGKAFARSLDEAYSKLTTLFPEKKFKIPVVIHSLTTQSNGYVAWAPKRMELYPTPEQNTIPLDPNSQLATHELAHVFQMEALNTGFTKALSIFLGEQITGVISTLLPLWFFEGDAVFAETVLTGSGRGRSASFQKQLKALAVENDRNFKYDKSLSGSYRDFVPDHYQSGYQMVAWSLSAYDPQIWNKALKFTGSEPFTLNPVNISLSRSAGLKKEKLYRETFDTLKAIWTKEVSGNNSQVYETLNPPKDDRYINYYSPVIAGTDSIIAIKTSLAKPPSFVLITSSGKTEKKIHTPGQIYPWYISCAEGKLVWVESESDPRWENRNYSVIKVMDLSTYKTIKLTRKSRYLSASISPDGERIAAVENTSENINNLVIIDPGTGNVIQSVATPGNIYLQRPQWADEGGKISVIYLTEAGEGIMSYSLADQKWENLIDAGRDDLQSSFLRNDSLFFVSSKSGTDNIYLKTPDNNIRSLTNSRFGVSDLCVKGDNIYFSDYTSKGNTVCTARLLEVKDTLPRTLNPSSFLINRINIKQPASEIPPGKDYTPIPYRKWQHLFRFHSWMPFYADLEEVKSDPASIRPGITVMTQNNLSSLISTIGYEYSAEKNNVFHTRLTWKGWYPVLETQLDYGDDPKIYKTGESVGDPSDIQSGIRFTNTLSVPLQFTSGKFSEYLRPSFTSEYNNKYIYIKEEGTYDYGQTILSGRLYFSNYYRTALRDIYPKWAQSVDINYAFAPLDKAIYGTDISLKTSFYFPGIFPNHGIKLRLEKEKQDAAKYLYGNRVSFPRGYNEVISKDIGFVSADYVFPIVYPDFNLASLLYLKRIRNGFFYDYASGTGNYVYDPSEGGSGGYTYHNYTETFKSFGFELLADFYVLRIPFMISGGVQAAWKNPGEKPTFQLLFNIDLFGMTLGRNRM
jgi:hypothetical protein